MKTTTFKAYASFLIYFFIQTTCMAQKLVFEHVGISDKPLPTIEININKVEKSDFIYRTYVVDKKTFEIYENYTTSYFDKNALTKEVDYDYGTYKVTVYSNTKTTEYFLESKEKSYAFFKGFIEIVKSNDKLYKEIWYLLERLN